MANCERCGAPAAQGVVTCTFCGQAVSAEASRTAIPCGRCRTLNAWGMTRCLRCSTWLVVQCVFCGNLSPHTLSACMTCNEAFAGSRERKAQRDAQTRHQQTMQTVGTVGGVAAPFLGAVAGSMLGGWAAGGYHHHPSYDNGNWGNYDQGGWSPGTSGSEGGGGAAVFDGSGVADGGSDGGSFDGGSFDVGGSDGGGFDFGGFDGGGFFGD